MSVSPNSLARKLWSSPLLQPLNDSAALNDLLAQVQPLWSLDRVKARVERVIDETADTRTFVLRPNRLWRGHRAGQHVGVEVEIDGVRHQRSYTLSAAPGTQAMAITVKRQTGGKVSNALHDRVRAGDVLTLSEARGEFVLPDATQTLLMLSAGSGITPLMSMLRTLDARGTTLDIDFVHQCRTPADAIFAAELRELAARHTGLRLHLHYSREQGRLDAAGVTALVPDYAQRMTLMCGPQDFMDAIDAHWQAQGLAHALRKEHFARRLASTPATTVDAQISCARSERRFDSRGAAPLLEEAEAAGLRPQHGCRIGICHSCKCKKISGTVQNLLTGEISSEPDQMIQLCVSAARSDLTLDL